MGRIPLDAAGSRGGLPDGGTEMTQVLLDALNHNPFFSGGLSLMVVGAAVQQLSVAALTETAVEKLHRQRRDPAQLEPRRPDDAFKTGCREDSVC